MKITSLYVLCISFALWTDIASSFTEVIALKSEDTKVLLLSSTTAYLINVTGLTKNLSAIQLFAASDSCPVSLSLGSSFFEYESVNGSSVGITIECNPSLLQKNFTIVYAKLISQCGGSNNVTAYVLLQSSKILTIQPIPGGCNLVHSLDVYPNLDTSYTQDGMAKVAFAPASVGYLSNDSKPICDAASFQPNRLQYDVYVQFFDTRYQYDTSSFVCSGTTHHAFCKTPVFHQSYFEEMSATISMHSKHGTKIATLDASDKTQYYLAPHQCTRFITVIVVRDSSTQTSSVYNPEVINPAVKDEESIIVKVVFVLVALLGLLLCFLGHRYFALELIGFGAIFFMLIMYYPIEIFYSKYLSCELSMAIIIGVGAVGGIFITGIWWRFGYAEVLSLCIGFLGGFLLSGIAFMTPLTNLAIFRARMAYVLTFFCVTLLYIFFGIVIIKPHRMCIVTSSFVGSFLVVASFGSGLYQNLCSVTGQFLPFVINKMFGQHYVGNAFYVVHLYTADYVFICVWCVLFLCGLLTQLKLQRGRKPFPMSPYQLKINTSTAPTPCPPAINDETPSTTSSSDDSHCSSFCSRDYDGDVSDTPENECDDDTARLLNQLA